MDEDYYEEEDELEYVDDVDDEELEMNYDL